MAANADLDGLADELLLHISHPLKGPYRALYSFCLVNRRFRQIGQEVLFRHCDLSARPIRECFLLLRTLLENPGHATWIHSVQAPFDPHMLLHEESWNRKRSLHNAAQVPQEVVAGICTLMVQKIKTMASPPPLRVAMIIKARSEPLWTSLCILPCLAKNIRTFECKFQECSLCTTRSFEVVRLWGVSALSVFQKLHQLKMSIELRECLTSIQYLTSHSWLFQISVPVTLDLQVLDSYRSGLYDYDEPTEPKYNAIQTINFSGTHIGNLSYNLLWRCSNLRKLAYSFPEFSEDTFDGPQAIWDHLPLVQDTLKELDIHYTQNTPMWPDNLECCSMLRSLKLTGSICPDLELFAFEDEEDLDERDFLPIGDFFSPNIEYVTIDSTSLYYWCSQDSSNTIKDNTKVYRSFEAFLSSASTVRPTLRQFTFRGIVDEWKLESMKVIRSFPRYANTA